MLLLVVAAPAGCKRSAQTSAKNTHNILLVTLDTTRVDYLGCYESRRVGNTPNFDALAADGVRFATCFSASAATPVSHASILSGLYPFQHGMRVIYAQSGYRLQDNTPYLPAVLKEAGWQTAAFLSSFTVSEFYGFDRAFDLFDSGLTQKTEKIFSRTEDGVYVWALQDNQRRSDKTTDAALEWLTTSNPDQPFCLWVHYWDPHDVVLKAPETGPPEEFYLPFLKRNKDRSSSGAMRAMYEAEVAFLDFQFGRLIRKLKQMGRYDNTIIVVVSDHGEGLGEHDWWRHTLLYEEQIRVPLIMRIPNWPTGGTISGLVRTIDIYPTLLDALGIEDPRRVAGLSLRGLIHGTTEAPRMAYADALNKYDTNSSVVLRRPKDGNLYCVTDGVWKLIWRLDHPGESELYNIAEDPDEALNLFRTNKQQARRLQAILEKLEPFRTKPFPPAGLPRDLDALRALESLGYIGNTTSQPAHEADPND